MFIKHLKRLGLYMDAANDGGGGGGSQLSIDELTDAKINGTLDDPDAGSDDPKPPKKPAGLSEDEDEAVKKTDTDPDPDEDEDDDPTPKKKAAEEEEDDEDPAPKKKKKSDSDEDGEEYYYDPEKHVKGKPAHSNKFKTKEQAEYAAVHKASQLKDTLDKMEEAGVGRGAIPLPKALQGSVDSLDDLTNLEVVVAMEDNELRNFLNESDSFRQKLEGKMERQEKESQARATKDRFEKLQVEAFDNLQKFMSVEEVKSNLDKFANVEKGIDFVNNKINDKIKSELKEDRDNLEAWVDKVDNGEIDLSIKEYDKEKEKRVKAIQEKERELRGEYEPVIEQLEELEELSGDVDKTKTLTKEQKMENTWSAFDEWQTDRSGDLEILEDTPEARAELVSFKKWVIQNAADFEDLQDPADFNKAISGWEDFKERVRAGRQKDELKGGKKKSTKKGQDDDDIPKPGDQDRLKGDRKNSVGDVRRRSMDKLVELTDAAIGS